MSTTKTIYQQPYARWLMSHHLDDCERLDLYYSDAPIWTVDDITRCIKSRNNVAMGVVDQAHNDELQGYMVYDCAQYSSVHVYHLAWSTELFGAYLLEVIKQKLVSNCTHNRTYATIDVHERDVRTQLLLQRYGYRWIWTRKGSEGDVYTFRIDRE